MTSGPDATMLTLASGCLLDTGPFELLEAAAAAGFDGVGLRLSAEHGGDPVGIGVAARHLGLVVFDAEVHRIGATGPNPTALIDAAAAAGASALLVVSDLDERSATMGALRAIVAQATDRGLRVGLEYMAWTDPASPLEAIEVADETGADLVVDVLHHSRVGAGVSELQAVVESGHLGWVQLCDAPALPPLDLLREARNHRLPPGSGALALGPLLDVLPDGVTISVEVQSEELRTIGPRARAQLLADAARSVVGDAAERRSRDRSADATPPQQQPL